MSGQSAFPYDYYTETANARNMQARFWSVPVTQERDQRPSPHPYGARASRPEFWIEGVNPHALALTIKHFSAATCG